MTAAVEFGRSATTRGVDASPAGYVPAMASDRSSRSALPRESRRSVTTASPVRGRAASTISARVFTAGCYEKDRSRAGWRCTTLGRVAALR